MDEPLIFEISRPGRVGVNWKIEPEMEKLAEETQIPQGWIRDNGVEGLPEVSEFDIIRHFTRLSTWNFHVDANFYPLGSCTMKYNPRISEKIAALDSFLFIHPYQSNDQLQGVFDVLWQTGDWLKKLSGMPHISMQPAAGAQGELTALLMFHAYHRDNANSINRDERKYILVPDSAHGTNPASAAFAGFEIRSFKSEEHGLLDIQRIRELIDTLGADKIAGAMITNPNTLGFFESQIKEISDLLHSIGALLYIDGANFNAILEKTNFGLMGADAVHFNLHKTFSTPHGGGGPGAGPIGVSEILKDYLPWPIIEKKEKNHFVTQKPEKSIGKVKAYFGNFAVIVRALAYMKSLGREHFYKVSERSVLAANYMKSRLKDHLELPFEGDNMHEVVFSDKNLKKDFGITTVDLAKALLDKGFHAPTIYFPLIVPGAIMIEPTDTESKDTLDAFCDAVIEILKEAKENPDSIHNSPYKQRVGRLDEVQAARKPILSYQKEK